MAKGKFVPNDCMIGSEHGRIQWITGPNMAAYDNPNDSTYYNYPSGSDRAPMAVASGTSAGTAVYGQSFGQGPADVSNAVGYVPL